EAAHGRPGLALVDLLPAEESDAGHLARVRAQWCIQHPFYGVTPCWVGAGLTAAAIEVEFMTRVEEIQSRITDIQQAIREGSILLSVELFKHTSAAEPAAFLNDLSPEARDKYKRQYPTRFSASILSLCN